MSFALFGLLGKSAEVVRTAVGVGETSPIERQKGWTTLRRWARAVSSGVLFSGLLVGVRGGPTRDVARVAASALIASSRMPEAVAFEVRAFAGARLFA